ncbi:condensin complex protein MksE [Phaeodactylibacter luteus]|uniref:DUF4194 domain-containing protein n=1 Tax=Phaeodactylibacter luteus TaxID=1564516 RepID=A0A5C6RHH0_9BACT|nr:hypothetical protein [Phaeodactylibacter luteus]TXB61379.1 hypothetical protein FRY97_19375 [Phaeodactylibacter luteus]
MNTNPAVQPASYPAQHQEVVEALLVDGRFLLEGDPAFMALKQHLGFYQEFFRQSFGLALEYHSEYAFLQSSRDTDPLSRDICIFLGVLCYELDREGYNLLEQLSFHTLEFEQVEQFFELSSFREVLEATSNLQDAQARRNFYNRLHRRRIIEKVDDQTFRFTPAHKYFLQFARGVARYNQRMAEEEE